MKNGFACFLFLILISLISCDQNEYLVPPQRVAHLHNGLGSEIKLSFRLEDYGREVTLKPGEYSVGYGSLIFDFSYYSNNVVVVTLSDGKKKMDFDCTLFPENSPYHSLCQQDSVSVFLKSNYWQEVRGIDTIYHYFIGEKDSLEAF